MVKIQLNSLIVQDQERALQFYTGILGFKKKADIPAGEFRWLTVISPDEPDGTQLSLEPNAFPAAAQYQRALFEAGIPLTSFAVDDIKQEYSRLKKLGVVFRSEPTDVGAAVIAIFEDSCGNLIQIYQET